MRPPVQPSESEENYEKIPDKFMGDGKIEHPNYFNGKMINPNQLEFTNVTNKYSLPPFLGLFSILMKKNWKERRWKEIKFKICRRNTQNTPILSTNSTRIRTLPKRSFNIIEPIIISEIESFNCDSIV